MGYTSGRVEQWLPGIDPATGALILPLWLAAVIAALLVAFGLFLLGRAARDGIVEGLSRAGLLLVGAAAAWIVLDATSGDRFAAQRRALDARLLEITARAIMPGSALACLDGTAGDTVEASCEKALFATPEAAAVAVAYVGAQLSLLADGSDFERQSGASYESKLAGLRLAVETDRFGLVAHLLAVRNGCTADQCAALGLLRDPNRVSDNLIGHRYDFLVARHAAEWPLTAPSSVAVNVPSPAPPTPAPAPAAKTPNNLFFPSSASIPAVSIMTPEPGGPQQPGAPTDLAAKPGAPTELAAKPGVPIDLAAKPPAPARKPAPAPQQARRPATPTAPGPPAPAPGQATDN